MMDYEIGKPVACLHDTWQFPEGRRPPPPIPLAGQVYTVSDIARRPIIYPAPIGRRIAICLRLDGYLGWWVAIEGDDGKVNFKPVRTDITELKKFETAPQPKPAEVALDFMAWDEPPLHFNCTCWPHPFRPLS